MYKKTSFSYGKSSELLCQLYLSEPSSKFGWTFFKLEFKSNLQISISEEFSDILAKYQLNDEAGKFTKFMSDYFVARGCNVKVKSVT